ncbi:MAG: zinc-binding dehydrogenase [Candidatus Binatia bacterium]
MPQQASVVSTRPPGGAAMQVHVLLRPGEISFCDLPRPVAGPGEIVVRVRAALTCGTDVKAFLRGHPKFPMPTPFGHEFAGEVADVGAHVQGFRAGDAIMAVPTAPCGTCYYCVRQQENLCETVMETMVLGAYAEYLKLPARIVNVNVYRKPAALPFDVAALLEPLSCVMHGLESIALRPDDSVVLVGAGAISLLHLLVLRAMGLQRILVLGRRPSRAAHASRLGADAVFCGDLSAGRAHVLDYTSGRGADVVIECTGQVEVWEAAPSLARRGGQVVLFGGCPPGTQVRIDSQRFHYEQLRIVSPFHFTPRAVRRAFEMLTSGGFDGQALISGVYPLKDLSHALAEHQRGDGIKFAVVP